MKESNFQTDFGNWIKAHKEAAISIFGNNCVFELKIWKADKSKSFPLDAVKVHQIEGLLAASGDGLFHKISDSPIFKGMKSRFTAKKPCDCLFLSGANAFIVIWYYVKGERAIFRRCYAVSIGSWLKLALRCGQEKKKSFKIDRLKEYGVEFNIWDL